MSDRELGSGAAEHVELVAVEIAEVAGMEAVTALGALPRWPEAGSRPCVAIGPI